MRIEDKALLKKFLSGHCTAEETIKVQKLLKQPDVQEVMEEFTWQEWNEEEPMAIDKELEGILTGWKEAVNSRIVVELPDDRKAIQKNIINKKLQFIRYAAIWTAVFLTGGLTVWHFKNIGQAENIPFVYQINANGQPQKYILPDGSEVYLGAGSQLHYPSQFAGKNREVDLEGEAFFQVKHNPLKPFIIHTAEINTQVLGTSFKIKAFENQVIQVSVATGKVGVTRYNGKETKTLGLLTPGMRITWNRLTQQAEQGTVDPASLEQWKTGDLVFEEQTMEQIAAELQRRFNIKIDFMDKEITQNQVSGTFPSAKSIDKIMNTLAIAGKFRYETINNKSFKIYKPN